MRDDYEPDDEKIEALRAKAQRSMNGPITAIMDANHNVIPTSGPEWAQWMENNDRRVGVMAFPDIVVSTVFLGVNHSYDGGAPHWFETMVFYQGEGVIQQRYSTWDLAEIGHHYLLKLISDYLETGMVPDWKLIDNL